MTAADDALARFVMAVDAEGLGAYGVTLEHLLTMRSGIDFEWFGADSVPWPDLA